MILQFSEEVRFSKLLDHRVTHNLEARTKGLTLIDFVTAHVTHGNTEQYARMNVSQIQTALVIRIYLVNYLRYD